jgi:hypothetical protein
LKNTTASAAVYVGGANVSSANGYPLAAGSEILFDGQVDVYVVIASSTGTVATLTD